MKMGVSRPGHAPLRCRDPVQRPWVLGKEEPRGLVRARQVLTTEPQPEAQRKKPGGEQPCTHSLGQHRGGASMHIPTRQKPGAGAHLARPSSCEVGVLPGSMGALPKCRRTGCLGCRRLTSPSLTGSQSSVGTSSWLGSRQHSSTRASSGSLAGPSSRPAGRRHRHLWWPAWNLTHCLLGHTWTCAGDQGAPGPGPALACFAGWPWEVPPNLWLQ